MVNLEHYDKMGVMGSNLGFCLEIFFLDRGTKCRGRFIARVSMTQRESTREESVGGVFSREKNEAVHRRGEGGEEPA